MGGSWKLTGTKYDIPKSLRNLELETLEDDPVRLSELEVFI